MKEYELTVLVHPDLEVNLDAPLEKVRRIIADAGGKIENEDNWGKKRLQYGIKEQDFAVYVYFDLLLPVSAPRQISETLNITDEILRYLLVKADLKARQAQESSTDKAAVEETASK